MQIHQLHRRHKLKKPRQVGRGGKRGKTAGRGTKGQRARSGRKLRPELRDQIKKIPKLRGYRVPHFRTKPLVLNLQVLEQAFASGAAVNPEALRAKKLVRTVSGHLPVIKILGVGRLSKALHLSGFQYSASVKTKVEAAGGSTK